MNVATMISDEVSKIMSDRGRVFEITCSPGAHSSLQGYYKEATGRANAGRVLKFSGLPVRVVQGLPGKVVVVHFFGVDGVMPRSRMVTLP